jgi:hypothetical protein
MQNSEIRIEGDVLEQGIKTVTSLIFGKDENSRSNVTEKIKAGAPYTSLEDYEFAMREAVGRLARNRRVEEAIKNSCYLVKYKLGLIK